jgi:opacity protein-like surface antigen
MKRLCLAAVLVAGLSSAGLANDLLATEQFSGTTIAFVPQQNYANLTLRVTGPNAFQASASYSSGVATVDLSRYGAVSDGIYNYYLTGTTGETVLGSNQDDGRKTASPYRLKDVSKGGSFRVQGGAIVSRNLTEPKRTR